ncbi:MAG: UvrB/UvrC motif-containing protein [Verrucomicrobiota bacterium]
MYCEHCKKEKATVFLTQVINGVMHKVDLCESCAKKFGVSDASGGFSLADVLLQMGEAIFDPATILPTAQRQCPACGYSQNDFRNTGRLGCPACYEVFGDLLNNLLQECQKSSQHRGKVPRRQVHGVAEQQHVADLEKKLADAVQKERFEEAAWLRDQIRILSAQP